MPELCIDRLAYGGSGIGRLDGKACFVPYTAPGDRIDVRIEKCKASYSEGVMTGLLSPSKERISPPCPVFGICGGCNWQHIKYEEQCAQKEHIYIDTLWRTARLEKERINPIKKAANPFGYRQRIQLKVNYSCGRLSLGFNRKSSHFVVDIGNRCAIAVNPINLAIPEIREIIASFKEPDKIPQVDLAAAADGSVAALFHYIGSATAEFADHLNLRFNAAGNVHSVSMQTGRKNTYRHIRGVEKLKYSLPDMAGKGLELFYSPDSFSQVNFAQNEIMVQTLLDFCSSISTESVLDLFCGNGNFSLPLAAMADKVLGLESVAKSVDMANYNVQMNGIGNSQYNCMDSAAGIEDLVENGRLFDLIILDPPRAGAAEVAKNVHRIAAQHLVYISCDPPTQARDIATLKNNGFEVIHAQPFDMFPQTYHLESMVFLRAN